MIDSDKTSWELGWDFAHFEWPIPEDADKSFCDGYKAFQHGGKRPARKNQSIYDKKWLQLRMNAWRREKYFDPSITPEYLHSIMPFDKCCPVTQEPFTFATKTDTDWSIDRAANDESYVRNNLIVISVRANKAKSNLGFERICEFADGSLKNDQLSQREWQRLAELVEPMNDEPGRRGVFYLEGQKVAEGVTMTPVAHFQNVIAQIAIDETGPYDPRQFAFVFKTLADNLCNTKEEKKAFRSLLVAVRQRAKRVRHADRLWATPKVHKKMADFLRLIGPDAEHFMPRLHTGLEGAMKEIVATVGLQSASGANS